MASAQNPSQTLSSRRRYILAASAIGLFLIAIFVFLNVGRWLLVEDSLEKADAIVVLSGRLPVRAMEAARLYREGYASKIWLTKPLEPRNSMESLGIHYDGEDFYNFQVLLKEGVPEKAIRILPEPIVNTADEILVIGEALATQKGRNVIIVTTKAHTRRVRYLWHRIANNKGRAIVRAAAEDPFDPGHWWRTSGDALDVVREVFGILNAWAGLPLHGG